MIEDINPLYYADGYKLAHIKMLAKGTTRLYGTKIPRKIKYMPKGVDKVVVFGEQMAWLWLDNQFKKNFFGKPWEYSEPFAKDISAYLGLTYDGSHFKALYDLGYLPIRVKTLPEGLETPAGVPHSTFVNTVDGFAWLTLYLETINSADSWKQSTSATYALAFRRNATKWVMKTDPAQAFLIPYLCHDFSARGLSPWDMVASGLGHATSFRGSDTLPVIPAARMFYGETDVTINSVNASEHSVSTTKIFTVGERQMILDWMEEFPEGILSVVADTFDLWKFITEFLVQNKEQIMSRNGKLVVRPDSGNPVDIICGEWEEIRLPSGNYEKVPKQGPQGKGVVELLWDIFGGTINEQGYKVLDPHIGAIYGDSINLDKQVQIYERLAAKGFAATNIVLGVGSFTYQYNSRDSLGWAVKGAWFEVEENGVKIAYNIYKDPITDNGTKKSLKGLIRVNEDFSVQQECTWEEEAGGLLQILYENGVFYNLTTLTEIRERINKIV